MIKQCFHQIPESDVRAKIGPMDLVAALVFGFFRDSGRRTLGSLRRSVAVYTGTRIDRSSFWLRMAANRLVRILTALTLELMRQLATRLSVGEHLLEMFVGSWSLYSKQQRVL